MCAQETWDDVLHRSVCNQPFEVLRPQRERADAVVVLTHPRAATSPASEAVKTTQVQLTITVALGAVPVGTNVTLANTDHLVRMSQT